jgi:hypothetical protein
MKERDSMGAFGMGVVIALKQILNCVPGCRMHLTGSRHGPVVDICEHSNDP